MLIIHLLKNLPLLQATQLDEIVNIGVDDFSLKRAINLDFKYK